MDQDDECARLIRTLEDVGDYRVLRRVQLLTSEPGQPEENSSIAAVVDVETTGLDHSKDVIIELCIRRIRFDSEGGVIKIDRPYSWLEAPLTPVD